MKGVWINHALVKKHSVPLAFFDRFQSFGVGVPFDLVWIVHGDDSRFFQRLGDFVDDVV